MTPTHKQVLAAIKAAAAAAGMEHWHGATAAFERNGHCDDLRATAERHRPYTSDKGWLVQPVQFCSRDESRHPCADYQQVLDRLKTWDVPL